jgi:hypothetical protein
VNQLESQQRSDASDTYRAVHRIRHVVDRLRWRMRAQLALRHALRLGAVGLLLFSAVVLCTKARLIEPAWLTLGGGLALALPFLGLALGLARQMDDIALAAALDASGQLASRLGSALAFARLEARTPMQQAAIDDALTALPGARPSLVAPWHFMAFAASAALAVLAVGVSIPAVWAIDFPVPPRAEGTLARLVLPSPFAREVLALREDDVAALEKLREDLKTEVAMVGEGEAKALLESLERLMADLQAGRLTPEEAHARLAALEKALSALDKAGEGFDEATQRLKEAAEKLRQASPELEPLLEALRRQALEDAARELEALEKKLENLPPKERERLGKDLERLAESLKSERQKERDRLEKERDRLKQRAERERDRFAQKDRDRLKETERQLEQLRDASESSASPSERQLERLADDLDAAAADLLRRVAEMAGLDGMPAGSSGPEDERRRQRQRDGQEGENGDDSSGAQGAQGAEGKQPGEELTEEELRQAAEALRRMAQQGRGRSQAGAAGGKVVDIREMLRRAAKQAAQRQKQGEGGEHGGDGQSGEGEGQGDPQGEGEGQNAGAGEGQGEGGDSGEAGFEAGARGQGPGGSMPLLGGKGQPGGNGGKGSSPGQGGNGSGEAALGEGIGQGHDKRLMGESTDLDVKTFEDRVSGAHGEGASKTRVIMAAAQKGFTSRGYADVHQNYEGVVEDRLDKEKVPPGKRGYVRRYFDLIRPR